MARRPRFWNYERAKEVATLTNSRGSTKAFLIHLATYENRQTGATYPSVITLARDLGVDRKTVMRHVARAERIGELEVRRGKGRHNWYRITLKGVQTSSKVGPVTSPKVGPVSVQTSPKLGPEERNPGKGIFVRKEAGRSSEGEAQKTPNQKPVRRPSPSGLDQVLVWAATLEIPATLAIQFWNWYSHPSRSWRGVVDWQLRLQDWHERATADPTYGWTEADWEREAELSMAYENRQQWIWDHEYGGVDVETPPAIEAFLEAVHPQGGSK